MSKNDETHRSNLEGSINNKVRCSLAKDISKCQAACTTLPQVAQMSHGPSIHLKDNNDALASCNYHHEGQMSLSQAKYPPASRNDGTRHSRLKDDDASHPQNTADKTEGERERERVRDSTLNRSHNNETHHLKSKKRDVRQGDAHLAESQNVSALPVGRGRKGEKLAKRPE